MDDLNVNSCRICFAANSCVPLFDDREQFNVASLLEAAINIKVQLNEHISSLICSKCFEMINTSVKLKQSVELAEERWNNFFLNVWISNRKEDIDQNMEHIHIKREEEISINNDVNSYREGEENSIENPAPLELDKREIARSENNDSKPVGDYIQNVEIEPKVDDGISNGSNKISRKHEATNKPRRCARKYQANRKFKCLECEKSFKFKLALDYHLAVHTGVKNHICEICNKSFFLKHSLNRHIQHVHYNEKGHLCTKCDKRFASSSSLRNHFRIHTGEKPFECQYCGLKYSQSTILERHTRLVHYKEKWNQCTKCDKAFPYLGILRRHLLMHTGEKPFERKYCDLKFTQPSRLVVHRRRKHLNQIKSTEKGHPCTKCDKAFPTSGSLRDHFRIHTGEKPFKCKYCDMKFSQSCNLTAHTRCKHLKNNDQLKPMEKWHACPKCDKRFITPSKLGDHFRIHTGEKPFECQYCDMKFNRSSNLAAHTRCKHPKNNDQFKPIEKRHLCTKCDKTFRRPIDLREHFRIHTGEKPFECKDCDMKFSRSSSLTVHTRCKHLKNNDQFKPKEKGHPCTKCDKRFASSSGLRIHFRRHTGEEKVHRCTKCDKRFPYLYLLKQHFRIHTGEKPFECKYCDCKFARLKNLVAHTRRKHLKHNDAIDRFCG